MTARAHAVLPNSRRVAVAVALVASCLPGLTGPTSGQTSPGDWPQWRGPARDGHAAASLARDSWPAALQRRWRVEVGVGHSSPVVVNDRIFQFARESDREVLRALSLDDGSTLWESSYAAPYRMNPAARGHGPGPKSTPAAGGGRLFSLGIGGRLSAFSDTDGEILWQTGEGEPIYGAAMSPMLMDDLVIAHVGRHHAGTLGAYDVASGEQRWGLDGDGPGYASPILASIGGGEQIVTQTDSHIVGLGADDGRLLWRLPFTTDYDQNVVTPLASGGVLVLSGLDQGVFAVQPGAAADAAAPTELWRNRDVSMYMSSPVLSNGRLFGFSHRRAGQFFALEPDTGEVIWTSDGREGENAAIVVLGDHVLFLSDEAVLTVVDAAAGSYAPIARYQVADSPTWAHPVPTSAGLLIRDVDGLALWSIEP